MDNELLLSNTTLILLPGDHDLIKETVSVANVTLLKMGRYYNTTMCHYWDMLVK